MSNSVFVENMYDSDKQMAKDFITRPYEKGDEAGIVKLLRLSFPDWAAREKPLEYWNWKYRDAPLGSSITVALSNEKVIGVGHEINLNIKVGSRIFRTQYSDDYATHPDFQRMGVYNSILKQIEGEQSRKIEFFFWITENPIVIKSSERRKDKERANGRVRVKFPFPIIHLFRIKDVSMHIKAKNIDNKTVVISGLGAYKVFKKTVNIISRKSTVSKDIEIIELKKFNEAHDAFWEQVKDQNNFIIEKKAKFLNWRYKDPPGVSFTVREARKGDKLFGFTVLQVRKTGDYSEGYILEIATLPDNPEIYNNLIMDACNYFDDLGLNAVHIQLVHGHPLQKYANRHGFVESPIKSKVYIDGYLKLGFEKEKEILESSKPSKLQFGYSEYY